MSCDLFLPSLVSYPSPRTISFTSIPGSTRAETAEQRDGPNMSNLDKSFDSDPVVEYVAVSLKTMLDLAVARFKDEYNFVEKHYPDVDVPAMKTNSRETFLLAVECREEFSQCYTKGGVEEIIRNFLQRKEKIDRELEVCETLEVFHQLYNEGKLPIRPISPSNAGKPRPKRTKTEVGSKSTQMTLDTEHWKIITQQTTCRK